VVCAAALVSIRSCVRALPFCLKQQGSKPLAHCGDTVAGDYVNSLTFTELFSGWTENRAVWNKSSHAILEQLKTLEETAPFELKNFHTDNGTEFLNWALYEHMTGRKMQVPFTRSRAWREIAFACAASPRGRGSLRLT
jgi:IS30 family transposase